MMMLGGMLWGLTACGVFTPAELALPKPDTALTDACPPLSVDPGRSLTQAEVEVGWGRDRAAARVCAARHAALVKWVDGLVVKVGPQ
jgi:hypothetical protein